MIQGNPKSILNHRLFQRLWLHGGHMLHKRDWQVLPAPVPPLLNA